MSEEKFIEIYPTPQHLDDGTFGWAGDFKKERMLVRKCDILKAWIHLLGEHNYVAVEYIERSRNEQKRGMYGFRELDMNRTNWSYALASKDFECLGLELSK